MCCAAACTDPPPLPPPTLPACLPGAAPAHICNADLKFSLINDLPSTAGGGSEGLLRTRSQVSWKFCCCRSQSRFCLSLSPVSPSVSASLSSGHNQRMEFLGDSIMQLVATEYLFIHFPDHHEGHLTVRPPTPHPHPTRWVGSCWWNHSCCRT